MPDITASIEYLQKLKLYETEKPYYALLAPHEDFDPDAQRLDNLEYETQSDLLIKDMRDIKPTLASHGFEVVKHKSEALSLSTREEVADYKHETEQMLRDQFNAVFVRTFEVRQRENIRHDRSEMDYNDPLVKEGPAKGAHNDITYHSGPRIIDRNLSDEEKLKYLRPGYRFRIVNTWRSLISELEDRPLALCDSRTVAPEDLVAGDRIIPDRVGEVYYLNYNPNHQWYWLEKQTPEEPFVFVMYDTRAGNHARFCPHVSFDNSRKSLNAPPRKSVETRSIIITRE